MTGGAGGGGSSRSESASSRPRTTWDRFVKGMVSHRAIHGHVLVPASFVIPLDDDDDDDDDDDAWPAETRGVPLGSIVQRLRLRRDFLQGEDASDRRAQLDGLGFVWDVGERNFDIFVRALRHFDRLEGRRFDQMEGGGGGGVGSVGGASPSPPPPPSPSSSPSPSPSPSSSPPSRRERRSCVRVPSRFVVPSGDAGRGWPPDLWDYPLGARTMAVRQKELYVKGHPHRRRVLEEAGFRWRNGNAALGWLDVVHAAAIYSQMHGRALNVPLSFAVPSPPPTIVNSNNGGNGEDGDAAAVGGCLDSWPWPERLWGLKLGQRLKDVRLKGAYLKVRGGGGRREDAIVWGARRTFAHCFGHPFPPNRLSHFPPFPPPPAMGVFRYSLLPRIQGPDAQLRRAQLDNLGFVWFPKRGRTKRFIEGGGDATESGKSVGVERLDT